MKCPYCLQHFYTAEIFTPLGIDQNRHLFLQKVNCVACHRLIVCLKGGDRTIRMIYPKGSGRSPVSDDVPEEFREDYEEAALILADSPKASAALSRRCLQHILQEKAGVKDHNLYDQIQKVIDTATLPSDLVESFHTLRELGNVGVHPIKNANTGEIVPVEPVEAEWCLDVIELLYDFYFVRPADVKRRQQALHDKRHGTNDSSNT